MQRFLEENQKNLEVISLKEQQGKRLVAACRAYFIVMKKNYLDNVWSQVQFYARDVRNQWLEEDFSYNTILLEKAAEPLALKQRRDKAKVTIEKMNQAMECLNKL